MYWYLKVIRDNYANFSGRARRQEYWMFAFINLIIWIVLSILDTVIFGKDVLVLSGIYSLVVLLPGIAVAVRRLHDTNRSGWWILLSLIPVIGIIVLLVWMCIEGTPGNNRFGPSPKAIDAGASTMV